MPAKLVGTGTAFTLKDHQVDTIVQILVAKSRPQRIWQFYPKTGYHLANARAIRSLPLIMREECVSRLRRRYRLRIIGEMGLSTVSGPLAPVIGLPLLAMILLQWSVDMAWAYGLEMNQKAAQRWLGHRVMAEFRRAIWQAEESNRAPWQRSLCLAGSLLFMGWGQELQWADRVMAKTRSAIRAQLA